MTRVLVEIRDQLREGARRQEEMLDFLKAQSERTRTVVDRSVALQETAVKRQRTIQLIAIPLVVLCLALIAWLLLRIW